MKQYIHARPKNFKEFNENIEAEYPVNLLQAIYYVGRIIISLLFLLVFIPLLTIFRTATQNWEVNEQIWDAEIYLLVSCRICMIFLFALVALVILF